MARRWRRRLFRGFMVAVALGAIVGATLPWWWPAMLHQVDGLTIGDWKTSGWNSVELHDVVYQREGLQITVTSVRVPAFGYWPRADDGPLVVADEVDVAVQPVVSAEPAPPPSLSRIVQQVLRAWPTIQKWLPSAQVKTVTITSSGKPLLLTDVSWDGTQLKLSGPFPLPGAANTAQVALSRPAADALRVTLDVPASAIQADVLVRAVDNGVEARADLTWNQNTARAAAQFGADGLMPRSATLDAPTLVVSAVDWGLAGYQPLRGALAVRWDGREFESDITAQAEPLMPDASTPPLAVDLHARGGMDAVRVERALVRLPGIEATLSAPLVITLPDGMPAAPAEFSLAVDLAQVPHASATGTVTGRLSLTGGPGTNPAATGTLTGQAIHWHGAEISGIDMAGDWQPGLLRLVRCDVRLADDASVQAAATVDLASSQLVSATLAAKLTAASIRPWVPAIPQFAELVIDARAQGPLARPTHEGSLRWTALEGLPGGAVQGEATWTGEGVEAFAVDGSAQSAAGVTLPFAARVERADDGFAAEVTKLAWQDALGEWWHLAQPARVQIAANSWAVDRLELVGDEANVVANGNVHWPSAGHVTLTGQNIDGARLTAFMPQALTAARLDALALEASWDDGPVVSTGTLRASYTPDAATSFSVETDFRMDATAQGEVALGAVRVLDASGVVLAGEGRLPLVIAGRADGFAAQLPRDGAITLKLASTPNPQFWESVSRVTGWQVTAPMVQGEISGTLAAPRGRIEFTTVSVQPPMGLVGAVQLPRIADVDFTVTADEDGFGITQGIFTLDGNWVSLKGRVPWGRWREARDTGSTPWREVEFEIAADRMPMTIASRAVPTLLAPDGEVSFDVKHTPGSGFSGFLWITNAALRPSPPLGAVRDIAGRIELEGYTVRLRELGALVGDRPITIVGEANVTRADAPVFDVHVESARVPLVRQLGLVLRAGLDVRVVQEAGRPAHISGTMELAQSVLVADLASMMASSSAVAAPEMRPPYFSVRERPFADWTLDVVVRGDDCLRIENPFFKGTISADFKLDGTLAEPRAIGRAWSDRGTVIFPFGNMRLEQFEAALTTENPFQPSLSATATTRLYGYEMRLEVSGSASDPRLLFSSDPALTSQEIFMLLSTGAMPDTEHSFTTSQRAQRVGVFVGQNLASSLGLAGGSGDSERLVVRSGEEISREGGETMYVQFNLDGRWSLVGEKDRFDAYNGGIKFRLIER